MPIAPDSQSNVTHLPRGGRDSFLADTAVRLDRLEALTSRLQQESEQARAAVLALVESSEQAERLRSFDTSLKNARDYKMDEIVRSTRSLTDRIDRIEGRRNGATEQSLNSFEAVNKRLQELSRLEVRIEKSEVRARQASHVLYAAILVLVSTAGAYFLPALRLI